MTPELPTSLRVRRDPARRRTSWVELFFDLVFVVAIGHLTHVLEDDLTWHTGLTFALLFVPTWWAWLSFSFYADVFESDTWPFQAGMLCGMGGALLLAAGIPAAAHGHPENFLLAYLAMRAVIVGLWTWSRLTVPEAREMASWYVAGFTVAAACWGASLLVPAPIRAAFWILGMTTDLLTPVAGYFWVRSAPVHVSHLPERLGLFTLIVLGEAIVVVATDTRDLKGTGIVTATAAFGLACALFTLYFQRINEDYVERVVGGARDALHASFAWSYGHLLIFAGITVASAAIHHALTDAGHADWPGANLLAPALAVTLLAVRAVQRLGADPQAKRTSSRPWWTVVALLVLLGGTTFQPSAVVLCTCLLVGALAFSEARRARPKGNA